MHLACGVFPPPSKLRREVLGPFVAPHSPRFWHFLALCLPPRAPRPVCTSDSSGPNTESPGSVDNTNTLGLLICLTFRTVMDGCVRTANGHAKVTRAAITWARKCVNVTHDSRPDWQSGVTLSLFTVQGRLLGKVWLVTIMSYAIENVILVKPFQFLNQSNVTGLITLHWLHLPSFF